jgi:two-component system sensor histidine kinase and response regulator WspE
MSAMDLSQFSLIDLFRAEAETQGQVLTSGLLALERDHELPDQLEACMRAAHSLKGAARIVGLMAGVRLAHAMEDLFVAAQEGRLALLREQVDQLLEATDLLSRIAQTTEADLGQWEAEKKPELDACVDALGALLTGKPLSSAVDPAAVATPAAVAPAVIAVPAAPATAPPPAAAAAGPVAAAAAPAESPAAQAPVEPHPKGDPRNQRRAADKAADRVLRVTAENLNRLLSLASESVVETRWAKPFTDSMLRLKRLHHKLDASLEAARSASPARGQDDAGQRAFVKAQTQLAECEQLLAQRLIELDTYDRRSINLAQRLYAEALAVRMRPFADGVEGLPRMVRDIAHSLGREVKLDIVGMSTQVDRDVLVQLDAPLGHLLRNAIDHGIESPEARRAAGKPGEGVIRIEARHSAGALHVSVSDDGNGVDMDRLRTAIVARNFTTREACAALSEAELLEFLFLPGFSMKEKVTDVSGRGVGLDAVQDMVKRVRGTIRVTSQRGIGMRFLLQLPVTLSVVRTLLAEVAGEPYAFPLASIVRALKLPKDKIAVLEGREHFELEGRHVGLVAARQVLGTPAPAAAGDEVPVIVMGDHTHTYGLIVDRFLGERELVVQPLDLLLGKIKDIAAGALMEDGSPVLIVDADDLIRSMEKLVTAGRLDTVPRGPAGAHERKRKRVLVVDDSLTVRELERKLIGNHGYDVEVAVDGMDGWNAVRTGHFDLVISDIDMPRMDGIELVTLINKDPNLKSIPVMIVSYKDRDEDRERGLNAGAAHYLTKGSFHDATLVQAVVDLIGEP